MTVTLHITKFDFTELNSHFAFPLPATCMGVDCKILCLCSQMSKQIDTFRDHLENFAAKHKDDIRKDAEFRVQFQEMCASIGVDPLACR